MNWKASVRHASILLGKRFRLSLLQLIHLVLCVIKVSSIGQFRLLLLFSFHVAVDVDEAASCARDRFLVLFNVAHLLFNLLSVNVR